MATKVKPSRLQVSGTPQVGQVPVYVDEDTFQWGAGGGGGNVKSFTLSSTSDLTTAQEAYDWYDDGNVAIIVYDDKEYLFDYATAGNAYWSVANEEAFDTASNTGIRRDALQLALSSGTVTSVTTINISVNDLKVLRTDKDYGTPYSPQYDGSPATKKYVDDAVDNLMGLGKFLSLWDATTGLPVSFPLSTPYTYTTGDYYLVETVSSATPPVNYKPTGSSYTGTASSTTESGELAVGDIYIYDGTNWLLQLNHGKTVSFSEIAGNPSDNTNLGNALSAKQDSLTLPATPVQGNLVTWGADNKTLDDGGAIPVTSVNGQTGAITVNEGITKIFTLSSTSDLVTAQAAYDRYIAGGNPILMLSGNSGYNVLASTSSTQMKFTRAIPYGNISANYWIYILGYEFTISSGSVTAITIISNCIRLSNTAPTSGNNSTITFVI